MNLERFLYEACVGLTVYGKDINGDSIAGVISECQVCEWSGTFIFYVEPFRSLWEDDYGTDHLQVSPDSVTILTAHRI